MRAQLVSVLLAAAIVPACTLTGGGTIGVVATTPVVYTDPPTPQEEAVEVRAGFVYIRGHQASVNGQWQWLPGHYERERAGFIWTDGRWEHRGNSWQWVEGSWGASAVATPPQPGVR